MGPLEGVRVLDLTRILAGPYSSQLLAQFGADVIKVEDPRGGEEGRMMSPPAKGAPVYYNSVNRGKRGVTLSFRHPEAKAILARLIERSDIVIENFRPGTFAKMGFGLDALLEINPRVVLVSISGFGQRGPYRDRAAFDQCAQAMSGVMALTGSPGGPPTRVGAFIADYMTGVYAALGAIAALRQRDRTGRGLAVDVSMLDALLSTTVMEVVRHISGMTPRRSGNAHPYVAPSNVYRTADRRHVFISAPGDSLFARLADAMGRPELLTDPRFSTRKARTKRRAATDALVKRWAATRTSQEIVEALDRAGVPCAAVLTIPEVAEDPHVWERDLIEWRDHPVDGRVALAGNILKLSEGQVEGLGFPPKLGEHTRAVYRDVLGMPDAEIDRLQAAGAI